MRVLQLVAVVAVAFLAGQVVTATQDNVWLLLVTGVVGSVLAMLAYYWVVRLTEKREVIEASAGTAASGLLRGTLLGLALFAAVIGNIAANGGYRVHGLSDEPLAALGLIGFMAAAAVTEELMFRGVLFRHVEKVTGTWLALALSALVFGAVHLLNENASLWGALCVAFAGGGMLTSAYIATRSLWLPIGLHFGWNYAQAAIFSTEVSGNGLKRGLLDSELTGSTWLSGGDFGPEASLSTLMAGVVVTGVFLWLAHRRGNIVPLRRREPSTLVR
ncbi:CPBP family intramembrane glutamic endopeptidase [Paractinoplanes lichenicola]|uniref:CPBP family intramembrane metalloprotease n=1 Tax=Paractinoplanes lichenicola TaxID=2802976 RepID=A0ABS1VEY4_9ACTN|nr:CPBP family intramembrane glutamic endopeptidase [Actinoplanes lichenicola]MBL7253175.1 CPBP family intramembrane metalloprotease [Actinoplanes lichenicola]